MSEKVLLQQKAFKEDAGEHLLRCHKISKKDYDYLIKIAKKEYRELAIIRKEPKKLYYELKNDDLRSKSIIEINELNNKLYKLDEKYNLITRLMEQFLKLIIKEWKNMVYPDLSMLFGLIKQREEFEKNDFEPNFGFDYIEKKKRKKYY